MGRSVATLVALFVSLAGITGCEPYLPGAPDTGREDSEIIGGTVDTGDPAVALIVFSGSQGSYVCTGTLIAPDAILTAGHCAVKNEACNSPWGPSTCQANPASGYVVFGGTQPIDTNTWDVKSPTWRAFVSSVHPHPQYGSDSSGAPVHDLAVLKIGAIDVFSGSAPQPMAWLATPSDTAFATGSTFRAVGYGITNASTGAGTGTKRMVTLEIDGHDASAFWYGGYPTNTCSGDSGGPAIKTIGGVPTVIGTTSYGDGDCRVNGVNMRTDHERAFIAALAGAPDAEPEPEPEPQPEPEPGTCVDGSFGASNLPVAIPDADAAGVSSTIVVPGSGTVASLAISLRITHTYVGDLTITLRGPDGTTALLWNEDGGSADDIVAAEVPLSSFTGREAAGTWRLTVSDGAAQDVGTIDDWSLDVVADCAG